MNADLAGTLRLLAREGPDAFYTGPLAEAIALTTQQRLGRMTAQDLASYEIVEREPARGSYRGYEVLTAPSPGGGPILLNMLGILEGFPMGERGHNGADALHLTIEAMRLAYADRAAYNADPDIVPVPQRGLAHPGYTAQRRALAQEESAAAVVRPGDPWAFENTSHAPSFATPVEDASSHTSHFIVVDDEGTIVSSTTTIEGIWGTGMVVPGYGFLLNNELTDFDHEPGGPNEPGPLKRPRSSMVPTIVLENGEPILILGAAGGPTITTSVLQVMLHVLDHDLPVTEAVAAPRVYGPFDVVQWDRGLAQETRAALSLKGHRMDQEESGGISRLQAAAFVDGRWVGAPDVRHLTGGGSVNVEKVG